MYSIDMIFITFFYIKVVSTCVTWLIFLMYFLDMIRNYIFLNFHSNLMISIAQVRYYFEQIWNIVFKIDPLIIISTVTFIFIARVLKGCIKTLKYFVTSKRLNVPTPKELVPKYCRAQTHP